MISASRPPVLGNHQRHSNGHCLPTHAPNVPFYHPSKAFFYCKSHCHKIQLRIDASALGSHPLSQLPVILLSPTGSTNDVPTITIAYYTTISIVYAFYLCL
mmetsp:Transcript_15522/g.27473  ORF Transcript_15522/g.27473 Transcript_15522/m.27473 type:complete len:101 (-) Transcript_15522:549-851(-)